MKGFLNRDYIENFIRYHKKTIIKVVIAFVLFLTAFFVFCIRDNNSSSGEFSLINEADSDMKNQKQIEENTTSNSIKVEASEKTKPQKIYIDISGAVEKPYVYEMEEGTRLYQAIEFAGGLKKDADVSNLNLAQILKDEDKIIIFTKEQINNRISEEFTNKNNSSSVINMNGNFEENNQSNSEGLININTATTVELQSITGVGPSTAEKIISYRTEHGNFEKIEEIMKVSGIGEKTFAKFKNKITV